MGLLLSCQGLAKQFGAAALFDNISMAIHEGERHGLIGPNGAGKSTLLKILAGLDHADRGEVALRKGVRVSYVPQDPQFEQGASVLRVLEQNARHRALAPAALGQAGFADPAQPAAELSGGWKKRLALSAALVQQPDLLLLDEPTNHLDVEGIEWLEGLLLSAPFAAVVITHDRYFLEDAATHMMELNRAYPEGLFRVAGNYSAFLEKREEFIEAQTRQRESLEAKVRREVEWLRRGAKARTRKAKARIDKAARLISDLAGMEGRSRLERARIDFTASERKTKKLLQARGLGHEAGGRTLFSDLSFVLSPGQRLGLAGANGSGKTTLLKLICGELAVQRGEIVRAENLRIVYFEQERRQIDPSLPLRRALAPEGDSVIYNGRAIHVHGWARRFLFREEQLLQPVGSLSGGERARVHIARLMLQEADLLLLDEPTNDLDIPTLEVLEQSLLEFPGAMILVTHDRSLMDRVATGVLGLDGEGGAGIFADLAQWEDELDARRRERVEVQRAAAKPAVARKSAPAAKKKLSYLEQREWDSMEERILEAEARLEAARERMQKPAIASDAKKLEAACRQLNEAQADVDALYARWAELESKLG